MLNVPVPVVMNAHSTSVLAVEEFEVFNPTVMIVPVETRKTNLPFVWRALEAKALAS